MTSWVSWTEKRWWQWGIGSSETSPGFPIGRVQKEQPSTIMKLVVDVRQARVIVWVKGARTLTPCGRTMTAPRRRSIDELYEAYKAWSILWSCFELLLLVMLMWVMHGWRVLSEIFASAWAQALCFVKGRWQTTNRPKWYWHKAYWARWRWDQPHNTAPVNHCCAWLLTTSKLALQWASGLVCVASMKTFSTLHQLRSSLSLTISDARQESSCSRWRCSRRAIGFPFICMEILLLMDLTGLTTMNESGET